ncbi:MAG TPA: alginate lyase family protein [Nocardioides sp.]|nr:alginate lyase family protein [Nocardioides sp.]
MSGVGWYVRRLRRMSAGEMAHRAAAYARQQKWAARRVRQGSDAPPAAGVRGQPRGPVGLHQVTRHPVPTRVRVTVQASGDRVLDGTWPLLGVTRPDLPDPDWFLDPTTGTRAPDDVLAFRINHRDEAVTGNVKQVWELSRHHHLTQLAAAYWVSGDERYAEAVDRQLRSWWRKNPFLSGIHWTSGIELGVRLVSWVWVRRLLDEWPKVQDLFEHNEDCRRQLRWHQQYLTAFHSEGSSGNNHAIAEDVGLLVAACGLPWFEESDRWREVASRRLRQDLTENTGRDGLNRELATDYHRFVTELALVGAAEARAAGHDLGADVWRLVTAGLDAAAAVLDVSGRPPRQGDGDEGRALVLDGEADPWGTLLSMGAATVGPCDWWPVTEPTVAGTAIGALAQVAPVTVGRPAERPRSFGDAGLVLLRTPAGRSPEIWCRCDGGPHGFTAIAAHAHADALSVEVRHDGVDILADPGTYCYHGEPEWRSYFRSTGAHNTIRVDGRDQSISGGPFMWTTHAVTTQLRDETEPDDTQLWAAVHDGYGDLESGGVRHQRVVRLVQEEDAIVLSDLVSGPGRHQVELFFHLGPDVTAVLDDGRAQLSWPYRDTVRHGTVTLPGELAWSVHHGETDPPLGWYSPAFGERVPATALVGVGSMHVRLELETRLAFHIGVDDE